MKNDNEFKVYYIKDIDSNTIFNYCRPKTQKYIDSLNEKNNFYNNLEESILKEGIRNPILVTYGLEGCPNLKDEKIPEEFKDKLDDILICDRHGGSRLYIAQKHNLTINCIVSDFKNKFEGERELANKYQMFSVFTDKPKNIIINKHGVHVSDLPHTHLKTK